MEAARRDFAEGVKLYQAGDFEGARRLFLQADAEHHAAPIVYNLALAEERLGHAQAAVDAYERYVAEAGEAGEFTAAATVAIAQLKARSTRVRIETQPSGARLFVDGSPLDELAPASVLVFAGRHVAVAQGDGWRAEREFVANGAGDLATISLAPAAPPPVAPPQPVAPPPPAPAPAVPVPRPPKVEAGGARAQPNGFVYGAAFAIAPYYLLGAIAEGALNSTAARSVVAGAIVEAGVSIDPRVEFLVRGFGAIGPDGRPTTLYMVGPGLSLRTIPRLWLGATFVGGRLDTRAHGGIRYSTELVFGAMLEAGFVVIEKPAGEWIASFQPSTLITEVQTDNSALVFAFAFGYRAF
ncbi:MAG TPA: hypothetical protein VGK73_38995 [Polyangiaceae bacterium]